MPFKKVFGSKLKRQKNFGRIAFWIWKSFGFLSVYYKRKEVQEKQEKKDVETVMIDHFSLESAGLNKGLWNRDSVQAWYHINLDYGIMFVGERAEHELYHSRPKIHHRVSEVNELITSVG